MAYPLTYTIPRKTLRITGAPRSKYSKPYQLPKVPWGVEADNSFYSLEAVPDNKGIIKDLSKEVLAKDSILHFLYRFTGNNNLSDDEIREYIHHQDHNIRMVAAYKTVGKNMSYLGQARSAGPTRMHLVKEFINHK